MKRYTLEQIEAIAARLREMPPVPPSKRTCSQKDAIRMLAKEIEALKRLGYTLDQVAETLRGEGLSITTTTLKLYLQRTRKQKTHPRPAPRQSKTASPATSSDI